MAKDAQSLVSSANKLYTLPTIYYQVDAAINDPISSATRIGRIIGEDAGLSARLLQVVNSAFFGFPSRIDTISRAVTVIGTHQLRDLILATSVIESFRGIPDGLVDMESFWRHSIATGVAARIIATYLREPNVERFFVAGLLHDIGSLVMFAQIPRDQAEVLKHCAETDALLHVTEREMLGFDHAEVGGLLLKAWKLPSALIDIARWHHAPEKSSQHAAEVAVVHMADIVSHCLECGSSGEKFVPPLDDGAWQRLGLSEGALSSVIALVDKQYQDAVRQILRVN